MTTIRASEYSPDSPAQPLTPLRQGQVALLNRGAVNDISQRVKTVVQSHLGYQGTDLFRTTFTKKEVTFSLKNGLETENRTLKLVNGHWMLSQHNTPAAPLNPTVEAEVNVFITEILASIGQASRANVPNPVHANPTVAVDAGVSSANADELVQIKDRLTALENQLRTNLTLEQSLDVQRQILEQLVGLRAALQKQPQANNAEKDKLQRQVKKLQNALSEKEKKFQDLIREARDQYESMKFGFENEKKRIQQALEAKAQQARELQPMVADLTKVLSEKEAEQKRTLEAFKSFKTEKALLEKQFRAAQAMQDTTESQLEKLRKDYGALLAKNKEREAAFVKLSQKNNHLLDQLQHLQKTAERVEVLEKENSSQQEGIESAQKVFAENKIQIESLSEQLEIATQTERTLQTQNVDLDSKLQKAEFTGGILNRTVQDLQKLLHEEEQLLKAVIQNAQEDESQLKNELERVKKALEKKENERLTLATTYAESQEKMRNRFAQKDEENAGLSSKLESAITENNTLNLKIQNLQTSLFEKERLLKQWNDDSELSEKRVNYYNDTFGSLTKQIEYQNLIIDGASLVEEELKAAQSNLNIQTQETQRLQTELLHLQATAKTLSEENNKLNDKGTSTEQVVATNATQIALLSEQLRTANQTQATLQSTVDSLQSDLDKVTQDANETKNAYQEAIKKESQLREDLKEYEEIFTETKAELTKAEDNNTKLTDQLESANKLNALAKEHILTLEKSLTEKDQELKVAANNITQIESLTDQLEKATQMQTFLQSKIKEYKSDRATAEQLATDATSALRDAEEDNSQMRTELEELDKLLDEQNAELTAIQSEKESLTSELEMQTIVKDFTQESNIILQNSLDEKDQQLKAAEENTAQFKSQLEQAAQMRETLQVQNTDLNSKLKSAEIAGEVSTLNIHELQESLRNKEKQLEITRIEVKEAKLEAEEAKLDTEEATLRTEKAEIKAKESQAQTLNELQKIDEARLVAQRNADDLEGKYSRLATAHEQALREIRHLKADMNSEPESLEQQEKILKLKKEENLS